MTAWSHEPPSQPGWYWLRHPVPGDEAGVVEVVRRDGALVILWPDGDKTSMISEGPAHVWARVSDPPEAP